MPEYTVPRLYLSTLHAFDATIGLTSSSNRSDAMTLREQLLQQALTLPADDQAFLAQSLEDHLIAQRASQTEEADGISGPELLAELQRRSEAYRSGQATSRLASEVIAEMRQRQSKEGK